MPNYVWTNIYVRKKPVTTMLVRCDYIKYARSKIGDNIFFSDKVFRKEWTQQGKILGFRPLFFRDSLEGINFSSNAAYLLFVLSNG